MRRLSRDSHDDPNYDSFLDIVANLVGILVILIMVIGVRARDAWQDAIPSTVASTEDVKQPEPVVVEPPVPSVETVAVESRISADQFERDRLARENQLEQLVRDVQSARDQTRQLNKDIHVMDAHVQEIERLATVELRDRNELQLLVALSEKALDERRSRLEKDERIELALARQVNEAEAELAALHQQKSAAETAIGTPNILEHRPTPLARTIFGAEEHFRLLGGYLAYVPIDEMEQMLERDAANKIWKIKGSGDELTETIGPVDGFRMRYTITRRNQPVRTADGDVRMQSMIGLKEFVMVPESTKLGGPAETELGEGTDFTDRVATLRPEDTSITVWTYPDSFAEFRQVKSYLSSRGFSVAARLLPHGFLIKAAPHGTRASAQ